MTAPQWCGSNGANDVAVAPSGLLVAFINEVSERILGRRASTTVCRGAFGHGRDAIGAVGSNHGSGDAISTSQRRTPSGSKEERTEAEFRHLIAEAGLRLFAWSLQPAHRPSRGRPAPFRRASCPFSGAVWLADDGKLQATDDPVLVPAQPVALSSTDPPATQQSRRWNRSAASTASQSNRRDLPAPP